MGVREGIGKPIGYAVVIGGLVALLWIFRDKIAEAFWGGVAKPVTDAVGGAANFVGGVVDSGVKATKNVVTTGTSILGNYLVNPVGYMSDMLGCAFLGVCDRGVTTEVPDILKKPSDIPTEADILWAAKISEVGPAPTAPPPGAWEMRGTSIMGHPLYRPKNEIVGWYTDVDSGKRLEIWQMGGDNPQLYIKGESGGLFGYWASIAQAEQHGWKYQVEWI